MSWSLRWKMIVVQFIKCWNTGSDIFNVAIDFRRSKFLLFPIPCRHWGIYFGHKDFCSPHIQHLELANESSVKGSSNQNLDIGWLAYDMPHILFRVFIEDPNTRQSYKRSFYALKLLLCLSSDFELSLLPSVPNIT